VTLSVTAHADFPENGVYIGAYGGYMLKLGDWNLGSNAAPFGLQPKSSPVVGLRLGYHILPQLITEIGGGFLPLTSTDSGKNTGIKGDFDLYFHWFRGDFSPFIGLGGDFFTTMTDGDLGGDLDGNVHVSFGFRGLVSRSIALRAEIRDYVIEDYSIWKKYGWGQNFGYGQNLEMTVGIDFYLNAPAKIIVPSDRDSDGIIDSLDRCPDQAGIVENHGCPDVDSDHDGIVDRLDKCPDKAGVAENQGCPDVDSDKDSVVDRLDKCPDKPGPASNQGCPESDKDGDGIIDRLDKCPDNPGPASTNGCPETKEIKRGQLILKGVNFESSKSVLLTESFAVLDQVVQSLHEWPEVKIEIQGHTDNTGTAVKNMELSKQRAETVRQYLIDKGIAADRLTAVGYGQEKPIADNKTVSGRGQNRRVELNRVN
jgi:outer membrane protein OmpA-like peptidoglycan-associated protein